MVRRIIFGFVLTTTAAAQTSGLAGDPAANVAVNESAAFGEWSAVVNGLQVRVATLGLPRQYTDGFYLELRNAGEQSFTIPSLAVLVTSEEFPWRLQIAQGSDWKDCSWRISEVSSASAPFNWFGIESIEPKSEPVVILQPRETALLLIDNDLDETVRVAPRFRLVFRQTCLETVIGWSGTLEIPSAPTRPLDSALDALVGTLLAPTYFPPLNRVPAYFPSGHGGESTFIRLWASNRQLRRQLMLYQDAPIMRELEKRLMSEVDFSMQLVIAVEAAIRGSVAGKEFILKAMEDIDYSRCISTLDALGCVAQSDKTYEWICDALIAALKDQRRVTDARSAFADGSPLTVCYLAREHAWLTRWLGEKRCRDAVPMLFDLASTNVNRHFAIEALGEIGDPAAVTALFEIANKKGMGLGSRAYVSAARALVDLKVEGVADELLANAMNPDIVKLLERTEDKRAIPVLKQIVSTAKPRQANDLDFDRDRALVDAARIALATLEPGDRMPRYGSLMLDQSLDEYARCDVIRRLREKENVDPCAIPFLLRAAREDPSGSVVQCAIGTLGKYHYAEAVSGLIELFDAHFEGKHLPKCSNETERFREHIAESLQEITGQWHGMTQEEWKKWWTSQGETLVK